MSGITRKTDKNSRCTTCKRSRVAAIAEQSRKDELCETNHCEFVAEIIEEIEKKYKLNIVPKEKKIVNVTEKPKPKIAIVKKK